MKIKLGSINSAAALCAVVLAFTSTTQAGPLFGGFRGIDGGARHANRGHRINDPANHNAGDHRGRHRGRGGDDPANHDALDNRGGIEPGDDRGRHHGRRGH
jgi:hypothetical protein